MFEGGAALLGARPLSSARAELPFRAFRAVEGEPRVLIHLGIVRPECLPATRVDAADARALRAREHVHVLVGGASSLHRLMIIAHDGLRD